MIDVNPLMSPALPVSYPPQAQPDAVFVLRIAGRDGPAFRLDPAGRAILGRAEDALVTLADRLASRSHAAVSFDPAAMAWRIEDLGSRNGTWLDGVRVTTAVLTEGSVIRVGTTELVFRRVEANAPREAPDFIRCGVPGELEGSAIRRALAAGEGRWSMLLYQAGIRLLAAPHPADIVAFTLELAAEFTAAASFGWFSLNDEHRLEPLLVVPPGSGLPALVAGSATDEALNGRAVWLTTTTGIGVACIPVAGGAAPTAVLAAAAPGGLREADFDLLLTLATFAAAAQAGRFPTVSRTDGATRLLPQDASKSDRRRPEMIDRSDTGPEAGEGRFPDQSAPETTDLFEPPSAGRHTTFPAGVHDGTISLAPALVRDWQTELPGGPPRVPADAASLRIEDWQQALALEALRRTGGNVPAAAALLGVGRATLYRKLEVWGLTRDGEPPARE
jgi:hypothetical protein